MKYLDKYRTLGVTEDGVFDYFMSTLKKSIITWEYFTDFEKIKDNLAPFEVSLAILNTLIGKDDVEHEFLKIVKEYPKVRSVLPILIALRVEHVNDLEIISNLETLETESMVKLFDPSTPLAPSIESKLLTFFRNSGLRDFIASRRLKNIVDYCYGVEVGLDTNGRKNRTGKIMEKLVETILTGQFIDSNKYSIAKQASSSLIMSKFGLPVNFGRNEKGKERRIDFVLINKKSSEVYAIETNAYMGGGSKLKSTAGEYTGLHELIAKQEKVKFIWITDGPGWHTTREPLKEAFEKIDYVFNLRMIEDGFLNSLVK
jgi:type II restriction enzyme